LTRRGLCDSRAVRATIPRSGPRSSQWTSCKPPPARAPGAAFRSGIRKTNPPLELFKAAFQAGNEAFNRGDFATAFSALAPECEFYPLAYATEEVLTGPEEVSRFFEDEIFGMFSEWRTEAVEFVQTGDGVFVVLLRGRGTGRASGAVVRADLAEVWELRDGIPMRVREFVTWEEALRAAGLDPSSAAEVRKGEPLGTN
jgi:ketosteroid isomerase-like protein